MSGPKFQRDIWVITGHSLIQFGYHFGSKIKIIPLKKNLSILYFIQSSSSFDDFNDSSVFESRLDFMFNTLETRQDFKFCFRVMAREEPGVSSPFTLAASWCSKGVKDGHWPTLENTLEWKKALKTLLKLSTKWAWEKKRCEIYGNSIS